MENRLEKRLYAAIEKDDLRAFNQIAQKYRCGELRLGRFPVLSALYLCKSKKIISAYESEYIKYSSWKELPEPTGLSSRFIEVAGKCLRLYFSDIVTPAEMLMLCGDDGRLKKVYPLLRPNAAARQKLKTIYSVKYGADVTFEGDDIILARRGLDSRGKKVVIAACAAFVLFVAMGVSTPFIVNEFRPFISAGKTEDGRTVYAVSRLSAIDFDSDNVYRLKSNISVPASFKTDSVSCTIEGNGKTVTVKGADAPFGTLLGEMSGINFKTKGNAPLFERVYAGGNLKDSTVTVEADCTVGDYSSFVTDVNYGVIENVQVNVSGNIDFGEPQIALAEGEGLMLGGIAAENGTLRLNLFQTAYGNILNCTVNFNNFTTRGISSANATLAGVVGINSAVIDGCTVTGAISSQQVDLAGICVENSYALISCKNSADLTQICDSENWNPQVAGIVMTNVMTGSDYGVLYCVNEGNLTSLSTATRPESGNPLTVAAAGIAYNNSYRVYSCTNTGDISCESTAVVYAGGLCVYSFVETSYCLSQGSITAKGDTCYVGGILACSRPARDNYIDNTANCISECVISVNSNSPSYVGGIVGYVDESITDNLTYDGGGVNNSYFTGNITVSGGSYCGGIAGACGKSIYAENPFKDNYYGEDCRAGVGVGATVTIEGGEHKRETGGDVGATAAPNADIKDLEDYKKLKTALTEN